MGRSPFCKHMGSVTDDAYALQYLIDHDQGLSLSSHFWPRHSTTGQIFKQIPESLWILIGRSEHGSCLGAKCDGDGGYRSPYLPHAKRALYHLSYIPVKGSNRHFLQYMIMAYGIMAN